MDARGGAESFFFLSHRSSDKRTLRKFVLRLLDAGIPLWIDVPEKVVVDSRISQGDAIRYGEYWADEIERALSDSGSHVLFCWSKHAEKKIRGQKQATRGGLLWELEQGLARRRLIGVRLDKTPLDALPDDAEAVHWADLSDLKPGQPHETLNRLIAELKRRLEESRIADAKRLKHVVAARGRAHESGAIADSVDRGFAVYTADRAEPFENAMSAMEALRFSSAAIKPIILSGPDDEAPDMFLDRCWRANRENWGNDAQTTRVEWTREEDFALAYERKLSFALFKRLSVPRAEIAARLREEGRAGTLRAVVSFVEASNWLRDEPRRIRAWLDYWAEMEALSGGAMKAAPVLCIWMAGAKRPWVRHPPTPRGQPIDNRRICRELEKFRADATLAGVLAPFSREQAAAWREDIREALGGSTPAALTTVHAFDRLFEGRGAVRVSMKIFAETIGPVLARGAAHKND